MTDNEKKPPVEAVQEGELLSANRPIGQTARIAQVVKQSEFYSGPLPRPLDLEQYNKILPGLAERIVSLTEREQAHRHQIENKAIDGTLYAEKRDSSERRLGQIFALVIALTGLGVACALGIYGHAAAASVIGGGTLATMVVAFVRGSPPKANGARSPQQSKSPSQPQSGNQARKKRR